jgi:hypothetical protein
MTEDKSESSSPDQAEGTCYSNHIIAVTPACGPDLYSLAGGDATRVFGSNAHDSETDWYGRRIYNSFISAVQVPKHMAWAF